MRAFYIEWEEARCLIDRFYPDEIRQYSPNRHDGVGRPRCDCGSPKCRGAPCCLQHAIWFIYSQTRHRGGSPRMGHGGMRCGMPAWAFQSLTTSSAGCSCSGMPAKFHSHAFPFTGNYIGQPVESMTGRGHRPKKAPVITGIEIPVPIRTELSALSGKWFCRSGGRLHFSQSGG